MEKIDLTKARNKVLHYLKYRIRSEEEIRRHFRNKIPGSLIDKIVEDLKDKRFIDDNDFARLFTEDRLRNGYGKKAIMFGLRRKGVDKTIVDQILQGIGFDQEYSVARKVIERKIKKADESKRREKIYQLLLRRGFSIDIIRKVIDDENIPDT